MLLVPHDHYNFYMLNLISLYECIWHGPECGSSMAELPQVVIYLEFVFDS
jgi:hypothetical protein